MTTTAKTAENLSQEQIAELGAQKEADLIAEDARKKYLAKVHRPTAGQRFKNIVADTGKGTFAVLMIAVGVTLGTLGTIGTQKVMAKRMETPTGEVELEPMDGAEIHMQR